jgi:hypothetical protein
MSNTNTIRELLDGVVMTGRVPDSEAIRAAVTTYSSVAERREVEKKVRIAAKKIVGALDSNLPNQAAEHAADIGEALAAHTSAGASAAAAELPPRTERNYVDPTGRISDGARRTMSLLEAAAAGAPLGPKDLENVLADARDPNAARAAIEKAAAEVREVHATGQLGAARAMAKEHGLRLGDLIADREPVDPFDGIDDPHELAAMLPRSGQR